MNRNLQLKLAGAGAAALLLAAGAAQAEVSSTITLASDYDFRGITQNALGPAVQASLDWSGESGLYAGLWASNIDFGDDGAEGSTPDIELDLILGYAGNFTENLGYDVGATYYKYLGDNNNDVNVDYLELYTGLEYQWVSGKIWYSPDFGNSGDTAWYAELNGEVPLVWDVSLTAHGGYNFGDYWKNSDDEFYDWSVGLARSFGNFDFAVKYVDGSDLKSADGTPDDVFTSESKVVFAVSTTFPWGKAEE
ncbi:MAG: hypothetical protein J0M16_10985 [Gammaproteobacteria bacterium]|nr:hypothetical protein [Gammaproteobacteria bacterium]